MLLFHMLISLSCPCFFGLRNGKERDKKDIFLNDCSWMVFHGSFLLIIARILTLSPLYVTGVQTLALLWGYIRIIVLGRSQGTSPCTVCFLERDLVEAHPLPMSATFVGGQPHCPSCWVSFASFAALLGDTSEMVYTLDSFCCISYPWNCHLFLPDRGSVGSP